jgi:hypothetical protein
MNTAIFVILIAILATLLSLIFNHFLRDRAVSPSLKRFFGVALVGGIAVLLFTIMINITK